MHAHTIMLPLIIILVVATAFCCAAPTEQLTPIEPSRRFEPQPAFDTSDEIDLLPIREDGGYEALNHYSPDYSAAIQERDNGDIAPALSGAYSHIVRLGGLYQWTFGLPNNNFNISIDTCLKRSNVVRTSQVSYRKWSAQRDVQICLGSSEHVLWPFIVHNMQY